LLADGIGEFCGHQARDDVGAAAGRETDDEADRLRGILLRVYGGAAERSDDEQGEAGDFYVIPLGGNMPR